MWGRSGIADLPEELGVMIEGLGAHVHLQVPDHVGDEESDEDRARHGHVEFLPHRRAVETYDPTHRISRCSGSPEGGWLRRLRNHPTWLGLEACAHEGADLLVVQLGQIVHGPRGRRRRCC